MRLTAYTDYALRTLMYLATNRDRLVTISEIADVHGISKNHLMKVVHQLGRSGVVESIRGKGGGVRLARDPRDIRIGQLVRASEGNSPLVECLSPESNTCRLVPACRLMSILIEAFDALYESLDAYTLADLVTNPKVLRRAFSTPSKPSDGCSRLSNDRNARHAK